MSIARCFVSCAVSGVLLAGSPLAAQSVLTGTVREDSTGRLLGGVDVTVAGSDKRAITDPSGRYVLTMLPAGRRMVLFRSIGYRPVQEWVLLGSIDTVWVNPMMIPGSVRLDPIVVTATPSAPRGIGLEAFEERRKLGLGVFYDSLELRRFDHYEVADFLKRVPGMIRRAAPDGAPCPMAIYLDGIWMGGGGAPTGAPAKAQPKLRDLVEMEQIAAIEVYRGAAEVPVEYGGTNGACGVVLLWTRRR